MKMPKVQATFVVQELGGRWYVVQHPRGVVVPASKSRAWFKSEGEARKAALTGVAR